MGYEDGTENTRGGFSDPDEPPSSRAPLALPTSSVLPIARGISVLLSVQMPQQFFSTHKTKMQVDVGATLPHSFDAPNPFNNARYKRVADSSTKKYLFVRRK